MYHYRKFNLNISEYSVTRLGDLWKFLTTNSLSEVAQKDCWLLGYFKNDQLM